MKEFSDDNFKLDERGIKFSKHVEDIVVKGEIARYEQFLFFPQCFQKTWLQTCKNHTVKYNCITILQSLFALSILHRA